MPSVCRLTDMCTGHGAFPPRINMTASVNVFVNSLGAHRATDLWALHCNPVSCHTGILAIGSSTVFVNGLGLGRLGDPVSCGSVVAIGSGNVFAGG